MKTFLLSHRSRAFGFRDNLSWKTFLDAKKKNHNRMMRIRFTTTGCHGNFLTWSTLFDLAPPSRPRACWHLKRLKGLGIIEIGFRNWSKNMQYIVIERKLSYDETRKFTNQSRKSGSFSLSWDDNGIGNRTKRFAVLIIHVWSCPPLSLMIDKLICWSVWLSTAAGGGSGV